MLPLRAGVIGTGFAAKTLLPILAERRDAVAVVALCGGTDAQKTATLAARYSIPLCTSDFRDVANTPDLDLLFIASPHPRHYECVRYASNKAYHIICEKPLALTLGEIDELLSLNRRSTHLRLIAHQLRFHPALIQLKALLNAGTIGRPLLASLAYESSRYITTTCHPSWWLDCKSGGGMVLAVGTHFLDLISFLFDEFPTPLHYWSDRSLETFSALGHHDPFDAESLFTAVFLLKSGVSITLLATAVSYSSHKGFALQIHGTTGSLSLAPRGTLKCDTLTRDACVHHQESPNDESVFHCGYRHFIDAVLDLIRGARGDVMSFPTFESYRACHTLVERLRHCATSGLTI